MFTDQTENILTICTAAHKKSFTTSFTFPEGYCTVSCCYFFSSPCAVCGKVNMWHQFLDISNTLEFIGKTTKTKLEIVRTTVRRSFFLTFFFSFRSYKAIEAKMGSISISNLWRENELCHSVTARKTNTFHTPRFYSDLYIFSSLPVESCDTRKQGNAAQLVVTCSNGELKDQGMKLPNHCKQRNEISFKPLAVSLVDERDQEWKADKLSVCVCALYEARDTKAKSHREREGQWFSGEEQQPLQGNPPLSHTALFVTSIAKAFWNDFSVKSRCDI